MRALHCKWIEVFSSLVQKCYIYLRKTYKKNLNGLLWYFGNSVMATSNTPQHIDIKMFKSSYDCVGCWIIAAFVFFYSFLWLLFLFYFIFIFWCYVFFVFRYLALWLILKMLVWHLSFPSPKLWLYLVFFMYWILLNCACKGS